MVAPKNLGSFLRAARETKRLSLRDVERLAGVSNAYLSQLEFGRIKEPSPNVLFKLSEAYAVPYAQIMSLAGYPDVVPNPERTGEMEPHFSRLGAVTPEEADQLADYLEFIRRRRRNSGDAPA